MFQRIRVIAKRELLSSFVLPLAYVVLAGFLLISGFFFFLYLGSFNSALEVSKLRSGPPPSINEMVVIYFFHTQEIILLFLLPILSMKAVAEEKFSGAFELLATAPIRFYELIVGKFIGIACLVTIMLLLSFLYPALLMVVADPEVGPILSGCLGVLLYALALTAIGIMISAATKSQAVAGVVTLVVCLVLYVIDAPAEFLEGPLAQILRYLSPARHLELFFNGAIDLGSVVYFMSVIVCSLFMGIRILEAERFR